MSYRVNVGPFFVALWRLLLKWGRVRRGGERGPSGGRRRRRLWCRWHFGDELTRRLLELLAAAVHFGRHPKSGIRPANAGSFVACFLHGSSSVTAAAATVLHQTRGPDPIFNFLFTCAFSLVPLKHLNPIRPAIAVDCLLSLINYDSSLHQLF